MSVFPDWKSHAVHQRRRQTGCIPTGYEMILRAAGAKGVDFQSFQDEFDLDIDLGRGQTEPRNHFGSVANEIRKKYSWVNLDWKEFATGGEKVAFIDEKLEQQQPVLISLAMKPFGGRGWHIMPVVDATENRYLLLEFVEADGTPRSRWIEKALFAEIHDKFEGGKEVAFLAELGLPPEQQSDD